MAFTTSLVHWNNIPSDQACQRGSVVFEQWAGPLQYCSNWNTNATTGSFSVPSTIVATQAFIVLATIFSFFAATLGCCDAGYPQEKDGGAGGKALAVGAAISAFVAFVFSLAAFAQWIHIDYVDRLDSSNTGFWAPVWGIPTTNSAQVLTAVAAHMNLG